MEPRNCTTSIQKCIFCRRIERISMRQKVRKSIAAISIGVSIYSVELSNEARGRQRSAPTTIAKGIDRVFMV
jgi:hypothetical protein